MNSLPPAPANCDPALPDALAAGLRGLRADVAPARDLWPAIASGLSPREAATPAAPPSTAPRHGGRPRHRRRNLAYATAAALVLAVAGSWQLLPVSSPAPGGAEVASTATPPGTDAPLLLAADALAREYQGALREIQASRGDTAATAASSPEFERSAVEIRAALARDPDALYLFQQLQRIYSHRLALSLRQA